MVYLTTTSEVKRVGNLTNEYTDTEIKKEIEAVEFDIYADYPNFKKYSEITINADFDSTYYIGNRGEDAVYSITSVRQEDDTDAGWTAIAFTDWTTGTQAPTTTVSDAIQLGSDTVKYRVDWIPRGISRLTTYTVVKNLISTGLVFSDNNAESTNEERLNSMIKAAKRTLKKTGKFIRSEAYAAYDPNEYVEYEQYDTD